MRASTSTSIASMSLPTAKVRLIKLLPALTLDVDLLQPGQALHHRFDAARRSPIPFPAATRRASRSGSTSAGARCRGTAAAAASSRLIRPNAQTMATTTATAAGLRSEASVSFIGVVRAWRRSGRCAWRSEPIWPGSHAFR